MSRTRKYEIVTGYLTPKKWTGSSLDPAASIGLTDNFTGSSLWSRTPIPSGCIMQTTTDVVVPHYARQVANGQVFFNPLDSVHVEEEVTSKGYQEYYQTIVSYNGAKTYYRYKMQDAPFTAGINYGTYTLPSKVVFPGSTLDSCLTSAISQTSVNSANALETFAELGESVTSLRSVFTKAYRLCKNFRSLALQGYQSVDYALKCAFQANSESRAAAVRDAWLEARYGIRPLIYDIQNWMAAFEKEISSSRFRGTSSAYADGGTTESTYYKGGTTPTNGFRLKSVSTSHAECHSGCLAQLDLATVNSLAYQLGGNRILQTAWELVPYSFVVDWFLNVGKTIDSWVPQPGVTTLGTWRTVVQYRSLKIATIGYYPDKSITQLISTPTYTHSVTERRIVRVGNPSKPILPSLQIRLNTGKLVDLLGLLSQLKK